MGKNGRAAIGIDLGGTFIKGGVVSEDGTILFKESVPTGSGSGTDTVIKNMRDLVSALQAKAGDTQFAGIGIGVPGSIDTKTGTVKGGVANVPDLNGVCLREKIGGHFDLPTFVDNDATNAAKGELLFGAGKGLNNIAVITLGTGIGAGIILDGKVYHGVSDYAGELGHMSVVPDGKRCSCGKYGCIEAYASGTALKAAAIAWLQHGGNGMLSQYSEEDISPKLVNDLAEAGDAACQIILRDAGRYLGITLASVANLLNLECCVIGGGVAAAGDHLYGPLHQYFNANVLAETGRVCSIRTAELKNDAGSSGAAAMVFLGG